MARTDFALLGIDYPTTEEARRRLADDRHRASVAMAEASLRCVSRKKERMEALHLVLERMGLLPEQEVSVE